MHAHTHTHTHTHTHSHTHTFSPYHCQNLPLALWCGCWPWWPWLLSVVYIAAGEVVDGSCVVHSSCGLTLMVIIMVSDADQQQVRLLTLMVMAVVSCVCFVVWQGPDDNFDSQHCCQLYMYRWFHRAPMMTRVVSIVASHVFYFIWQGPDDDSNGQDCCQLCV